LPEPEVGVPSGISPGDVEQRSIRNVPSMLSGARLRALVGHAAKYGNIRR